jgi:hypothetical protein
MQPHGGVVAEVVTVWLDWKSNDDASGLQIHRPCRASTAPIHASRWSASTSNDRQRWPALRHAAFDRCATRGDSHRLQLRSESVAGDGRMCERSPAG